MTSLRFGPRAILVAVTLAALLLNAGAVRPAPARAVAPATFTHPGVMVSRAQLDFVKGRVAAGAQPWRSAYNAMMGSRLAALTYAPAPRQVVECGSYSNPNLGCSDETEDALAAYTHALAWYVNGDTRHAQKAVSIMNAWSAVITDHSNSNAPLQSAWAGTSWARAAEIIRYTYSGWPAADVTRFATMLRTVYLPEVLPGRPNANGNWELTMMDAALGIAVFLEDRTSYDAALNLFQRRVPAYFYLSTDGAYPVAPPNSIIDTPSEIVTYWHEQTTFTDGLSQETCRDLTHTGYGIAATAHIAETARIQGQDLYPQLKDRLRHALGFHAKYQLGTAVPSWLCGGTLALGLGPVTEVAFNALYNRLGVAMTNTRTLTEQQRPAGTNYLFVAWETLTHADNPN
jgi:hypothetical protein